MLKPTFCSVHQALSGPKSCIVTMRGFDSATTQQENLVPLNGIPVITVPAATESVWWVAIIDPFSCTLDPNSAPNNIRSYR